MLFNILAGLLDLAILYNIGKLHRPDRLWIGLAVWFIAALILSFVTSIGFFDLISNLTYAALVHASILLLGTGSILLFKKRKAGSIFILTGLFLSAIGIDAFFVEPQWLETSHYSISSSHVEEPLNIAIIADLQTDVVGDYEKEVLRKVVAEQPDLILLTGDYIQAGRETWEVQVARLNSYWREIGLEAPLGIYAVQGNVDPPEASKVFADLPVVFSGSTYTIDTFLGRDDLKITGLSLKDSFNDKLDIPHSDSFHIIFGHGPDFALGNIDADLLLAGHAHGGQVQLPLLGPLITLSKVPRHWVDGRLVVMEEDKHLIVSRGIGMERGLAPRIRFMCRPQLVFVTVEPAD